MSPDPRLALLSKREVSMLVYLATALSVSGCFPFASEVHRAHPHWGYATILTDLKHLERMGFLKSKPYGGIELLGANAS